MGRQAVPADQGRGSDRPSGNKPLHINGLDVSSQVEPQHGSTVVDIVQRDVDAIRQAGGVPHVNHPNFEWAITGDDLQRLERVRLVEIYNGHHLVNNLGGGGVPGMEAVWDRLLSRQGDLRHRRHDARVQTAGQSMCGAGPPGVVQAERLTAPIVEALERGDYAANQRRVERRRATDTGISIAIGTASSSVPHPVHRPERPAAEGSDGEPGGLSLRRRRGLRARQGARVERPRRLDPAGDALISRSTRACAVTADALAVRVEA